MSSAEPFVGQDVKFISFARKQRERARREAGGSGLHIARQQKESISEFAYVRVKRLYSRETWQDSTITLFFQKWGEKSLALLH